MNITSDVDLLALKPNCDSSRMCSYVGLILSTKIPERTLDIVDIMLSPL